MTRTVTWRRLVWLWGAWLGAAGCGAPGTPSAYLVYDLDPATGRGYRLVRAEIESLHEPRAGRGEVAVLRGGGTLTAANDEPQTAREWEDAIRVSDSSEVDIDFDVHPDGLAVPWDFDSAMMLTLYHHLDKAAQFFAALGVSSGEMRQLEVYYRVQVRSGLVPVPLPLLTDNAAYVVTLDAFIIPPRLLLTRVPLFANRGVVVHEYSHAVVNRRVWRDARVPAYLLEDWPVSAINQLRSLDEGVADLFAALAVGDADFIAPSIPAGVAELDRDLARERVYDAELQAQVAAPVAEYDPYRLGSVIGAAIWALRELAEDVVVAQAVIAALDAVGDPDGSFALAGFFDALDTALPTTVRAPACQIFRVRMPVLAQELTCSPN